MAEIGKIGDNLILFQYNFIQEFLCGKTGTAQAAMSVAIDDIELDLPSEYYPRRSKFRISLK